MKSFSQQEFVKPRYLTEASFDIVNDLWSKIENYIGEPEQWLHKLVNTGWTNRALDTGLENIINEHFTKLMSNAGFSLTKFSLLLYKNSCLDGEAEQEVLLRAVPSNRVEIEITVIIDKLETKIWQTINESIFHELVHIENLIKRITAMGITKVFTLLASEPYKWQSSSEVFNIERNQDDPQKDLNLQDEIAPYSGNTALNAFYKYKQTFKQQSPKEQITFINTRIIPNIQSEFSDRMRNHYIGYVEPQVLHKFYRKFTQELQALALRVAKTND